MNRYRIEKFEVNKTSMDGDIADIRLVSNIAGDIRIKDMMMIQDFIESIPDRTMDDHETRKALSVVQNSIYGFPMMATRSNSLYLWTAPIKVIFHDPATIVFWNDGTKTVVKCQPGDTYSKEMGLALCFSKKMLGNQSNFNNEFKKWLPEDPESDDKKRIWIHI